MIIILGINRNSSVASGTGIVARIVIFNELWADCNYSVLVVFLDTVRLSGDFSVVIPNSCFISHLFKTFQTMFLSVVAKTLKEHQKFSFGMNFVILACLSLGNLAAWFTIV